MLFFFDQEKAKNWVEGDPPVKPEYIGSVVGIFDCRIAYPNSRFQARIVFFDVKFGDYLDVLWKGENDHEFILVAPE